MDVGMRAMKTLSSAASLIANARCASCCMTSERRHYDNGENGEGMMMYNLLMTRVIAVTASFSGSILKMTVAKAHI